MGNTTSICCCDNLNIGTKIEDMVYNYQENNKELTEESNEVQSKSMSGFVIVRKSCVKSLN